MMVVLTTNSQELLGSLEAAEIEPRPHVQLVQVDRPPIRHSDSCAVIFEAMAAAGEGIDLVEKTGRNEHHRYSYATHGHMVKAVQQALIDNGLAVISSQRSIEFVGERTTQNGGTFVVLRACLVHRVVHQSGEWIEIDADGYGEDQGDKAANKAITAARKNGLQMLFNLATATDSEADTQQTKPRGVQQWDDKPKPSTQADIRKLGAKGEASLVSAMQRADVTEDQLRETLRGRDGYPEDVLAKPITQWPASWEAPLVRSLSKKAENTAKPQQDEAGGDAWAPMGGEA